MNAIPLLLAVSTCCAAAEHENLTIQREQANQVQSVWYDVRLPLDGRVAAINQPWMHPTMELTFRTWSPVWDGYSIWQNRPGDPINLSKPKPVIEQRDEMSLFYSQGFGTTLGLSMEIEQNAAYDHIQDDYVWGDIKVGTSWSFLRSRYGSASIFGGCIMPTGNQADWLESHGGWTPYVGLRFSRAFWFFALNAQAELQRTFGNGSNDVFDASPESVPNEYLGSRNQVDLTYRTCRFFRIGISQRIDYHQWKGEGPNLVKQTVMDTPTNLIGDFTIFPALRAHVFYGYDFLSNREVSDRSQLRTFGGGISCAF